MRLMTTKSGQGLLEGMGVPLVAGAATGWSMVHPLWAPAQFPALIAWGLVLCRAADFTARIRAGFWFGAFLSFTVLAQVGIPAVVAGSLFAALSAYWVLLALGVALMLRRGGAAGWLGAVSLLVAGEWAQCQVLPLFGTAQRFASAWVEYDAALAPSRLGGTTAVTLWVVAPAMAAVLWRSLPRPVRIGVVVAVLAAVVVPVREGEPAGEVRIGVCGSVSGACLEEAEFLQLYGPGLREAAAQGATLVVTPELALFVRSAEREAVLARLESEARRLGVTWVLGYSQYGPKANRAVVLNPARGARVDYDKTHWVPTLESYDVKGAGRAAVSFVRAGAGEPVRLGMMICQDDNFEDVSAALARDQVAVVAVPTFDWRGVASAHLNSARNRPREFGFVEARAAIGGISAIIDASGRVVASRDHFREGSGPVVASVPLRPGWTLAGFGRLVVGVAAVFAAGVAGWCLRRDGRACERMGKS